MPVSFTVTLGQVPGPAHNWWDVFSGCSKMYCPHWGDGFNEHLPDCRKLILNIFNMATYYLPTMCSRKAFHLSRKVTCPSCLLWEVKQLWPEVCVRPPSAPAASSQSDITASVWRLNSSFSHDSQCIFVQEAHGSLSLVLSLKGAETLNCATPTSAPSKTKAVI